MKNPSLKRSKNRKGRLDSWTMKSRRHGTRAPQIHDCKSCPPFRCCQFSLYSASVCGLVVQFCRARMQPKTNIFCRIILLGIFLLLAAPMAQAQFTFSTNADNTLTVTGYTGGANDVLVPASFGGLPVTSIGTNAFSSDRSLDGVNFPSSVTNISADAFEGCLNLEALYFGGNAPTADPTAFISSPNATVQYLPGTTGWSSKFDGLETYEASMTYSTNTNGTLTITSYDGNGNLTVPSSINGLPVTEIGLGAFSAASPIEPAPILTGVTLPATIASIGESAFQGCYGLTNVNIPSNITSIAPYTFYGAFGGGSLTIPGSVTNLGYDAFYHCGLANLIVSSGVTNIPAEAFEDCNNFSAVPEAEKFDRFHSVSEGI